MRGARKRGLRLATSESVSFSASLSLICCTRVMSKRPLTGKHPVQSSSSWFHIGVVVMVLCQTLNTRREAGTSKHRAVVHSQSHCLSAASMTAFMDMHVWVTLPRDGRQHCGRIGRSSATGVSGGCKQLRPGSGVPLPSCSLRAVSLSRSHAVHGRATYLLVRDCSPRRRG